MRRVVSYFTLLGVVLLLASGCQKSTTTDETKGTKQGPTLTITGPPRDGLSTFGNSFQMDLEVQGIEIVPAKTDPGTGGTGHFHVFIDKDPVAEGETIPSGDPSIVHSADNPIELAGLSVGKHRFVVVLGDKNHVRIGEAIAERMLDVEGPSVVATTPAAAKAGESVKVEVKVEGVKIVAASDDKSNQDGTAGHLHLFVNKDPTREGTHPPIPTADPAVIHTASTSIEIPANLLKAGENVIWVVLGYADHSPFSSGETPPPGAKFLPKVRDKIVITVS